MIVHFVSPSRGRTIVVQGGQFGSEGKGQIAAYIAQRDGVTHAVRTGSINAGHTVFFRDKVRCSMQLIPTPWVHANIQLVLGAGCYIEPAILAREVARIREVSGEDVRERLTIDHRCAWFGEVEHERSKEANRHHAMGATGKGCSEAIVTKMRDRGVDSPEKRLFIHHPEAGQYNFTDTATLLHRELAAGHNVLLEGTQGSLLDFNLGPYPFVTSRMTTAAAWLAEAGLPPVNIHTVLVLRSHPIRVAGNSGPLENETSWPALARAINDRMIRIGLTPLIAPWALEEFESTLESVLGERFPLVVAELGARAAHFEAWTPAERQRHRVALSEANAAAWSLLDDATRECLRFFELTTVTKKLRRVAHFGLRDARYAVMVTAPAEIASTFLNYDFPELCDLQDRDLLFSEGHILHALDQLADQLGTPISCVTTGPLQAHVLSLDSRRL